MSLMMHLCGGLSLFIAVSFLRASTIQQAMLSHQTAHVARL
jgi:hypothetical protein